MTILIKMDGGLIQDIISNDPEVNVIVHDYDCEGSDDKRITEDDKGKPIFITSPIVRVNKKIVKVAEKQFLERNK